MTNTTNKIEIRVEKLRTAANRAKEVIRSTKSLVEAVKALAGEGEVALDAVKALYNSIDAATMKAAHQGKVYGKKAVALRTKTLSFENIVKNATLIANAQGKVMVAKVLELLANSYELQGQFKGKGYRFIATSTVVVSENTMVTDTKGNLHYVGEVGFEIKLSTIFTDMMIDFLNHDGSMVKFRYDTVLVDNEKKMIAVRDPKGAYQALDLGEQIITCSSVANTEEEMDNIKTAQQAIINGFYVQVPGKAHKTFAEYQVKSAAQGRTGKWDAGELIVNGERKSITDFLDYADLALFGFAKEKKDSEGNVKYHVMDIMKDSTRPPLVMANGRLLPTLTDAAQNMTVKIHNKSSRHRLITLSNETLNIAITSDIIVSVKEGKYYVLDKTTSDTLVELDAAKHNVEQIFNDGLTIIDAETYKRYISTDLGYKFLGENSFRMTSGLVKGLIVPVKGLKADSGFDMITTEGNAKAKTSLKEGKVVSPQFSVIIEKPSDSSYKLEKRKLPSQVTAADMFDRQALIDVLDANIEDCNKVSSDVEGNMDLFKLMTGAPDIDMETGEEKESRLFNSTLKAINANVKNAKDPFNVHGIGQMLESYKDGLMAGNIQVDAKYNLMAQDVELFTYILVNNVKAESSGKDGVYEINRESQIVADYIAEGNAVIEAGNVVLAKHNGKGCFIGIILAERFPKTHLLHAAKIEAVKVKQYDKAINNGFYRSLIQFSAFDFIAISMAGADFDGDQCLVIFEEKLVNGFLGELAINRTAILDKYIDENGEVGDGVPFKEVTPLGLDLAQYPGFEWDLDRDAFGQLQGNAYGLRVFSQVANDKALINHVSHLVNKHVAARTIEGARIGQFTNIIMKMLSAVEDLENRLKTVATQGKAFRGFYNIKGEPIYATFYNKNTKKHEYFFKNGQRVLLEYPEYMETEVDITGNVVRVTFEEWATTQIKLIKADVLKWQWVLQYELDKNKHGGAFEEAMASLMELIDNPRPGCCEFMYADKDGKIKWKKNKEKFVYRKPTWLVSEDDLAADIADPKTPSVIRVMHTNLEALRIHARKKIKNVDNQNVYNAMSNIPEVASIYNHIEANQTAFNALGQELSQVYANYNTVVGNVSRKYNAYIQHMIKSYGVNQNEVQRFLDGKVKPQAFKQLLDAKQHRSNMINAAAEAAEQNVLFLESKYNTTLDDAAKAITSIVYNLVYNNTRIPKNYARFTVTQDAYSLVSGFSFFWKACMPQIAKANDDEMYAFYTNKILETIATTKSPQTQSTVRFGLSADKCWEVTTNGNTVYHDAAGIIQLANSLGKTVELRMEKAVTMLDQGSMVDALGNSIGGTGAFAMDYNLFLYNRKENKEVHIGAINRQDIAMFNGVDEATLELSNLTVTGGKNIVFATTTDVVVK